jgi:hypothetical protein
MARCEMQVEINAPVETAWALTQNAKRRPERDFRVNKVELLGTDTPNKGVKLRSEGSMLGRFSFDMEYVPSSRTAVPRSKCCGPKACLSSAEAEPGGIRQGRAVRYSFLEISAFVSPCSTQSIRFRPARGLLLSNRHDSEAYSARFAIFQLTEIHVQNIIYLGCLLK